MLLSFEAAGEILWSPGKEISLAALGWRWGAEAPWCCRRGHSTASASWLVHFGTVFLNHLPPVEKITRWEDLASLFTFFF